MESSEIGNWRPASICAICTSASFAGGPAVSENVTAPLGPGASNPTLPVMVDEMRLAPDASSRDRNPVRGPIGPRSGSGAIVGKLLELVLPAIQMPPDESIARRLTPSRQ